MDEIAVRLQAALGDRYRVGRVLGRGAMATVYLADDLKHKRPVAVKVLAAELSEAVRATRFLREIDVVARMNHPGILPLHDSGMQDGLRYFVMPYIDGETLRDLLERRGALGIEEALGIIHGVADALAYAHGQGLVHRDIKPENVLLQAGHPIVSDFGLASAFEDRDGVRVTAGGLSVGTPAYMSPEQAVAEPADHRADLYALGVLAYEMLAGHPPFQRESVRQVMSAHVFEAPPPLGSVRAGIPEPVVDVVMRCLEKDPARRPATAAEVMRVIESVSGPDLLRSARLDARESSRRTLGVVLLAYAALMVAVGVGAWLAASAVDLPDWVLPGSLLLMAAGVPAILVTEWVHYSGTSSGGRARPLGRLAQLLRPYATRRSVASGGVAAIGIFVAGVAAFMALRALGVGPFATLFATGVMAPHQRIMVADFRTHGLDSAVGPGVSEMVRTALSGSAAYSLLPPDAVASALRRMERGRLTGLDPEVAREIARREGAAVVVMGDLTAIGPRYLVSLRLVAADSGNTVAAFDQVAANGDELVPTIDRLTRKLRSKIGESFRTVRALPPLEKVTTGSFAALTKYGAGSRATLIDGNSPRAVELFREAVAADSTFAMGWRALAVSLGNAGVTGAARDSALRNAFRHRARATELERLEIEAYYYWNVLTDPVRAATAYEAMLQRGDTAGTSNLGQIYLQWRDFPRAERHYRLLVAYDSTVALNHLNLTEVLFDQGRVAAAESVLAAGARRFPSNHGPRADRIRMLYLRGDLDAYERALDSARVGTNVPFRRTSSVLRADLALLRGRANEYRSFVEEGARLLEERGAPRSRLLLDADLALVDVVVRRDARSAVDRLERALTATTESQLRVQWSQGAHPLLATAFARAGRPDRARAMLRQFSADVRDTSRLRRLGSPTLVARAEIALAEGRYDEAIAEFRQADVPRGRPVSCILCLFSRLGIAYDRAGQRDSAIAMLERFIDTPAWNREMMDRLFLPGAYERLGQLYDARGDRGKAILNYGKFVNLWATADSDLQPRVTAARRRLAVLAHE